MPPNPSLKSPHTPPERGQHVVSQTTLSASKVSYATPANNADNTTPVNIPSTPRHQRTASTARTPGGLFQCSSEIDDFLSIKVHTAKCSECDKRNRDTMQRCPGCTFQLCAPCKKQRQKEDRSFAHGNLISPGSWNTPGSTSKRRPLPPPMVQAAHANTKMTKDNDMRGVTERERQVSSDKEENNDDKTSTSPEAVLLTTSILGKRNVTQTPKTSLELDSDDDVGLTPPSPSKRPRTDTLANRAANISMSVADHPACGADTTLVCEGFLSRSHTDKGITVPRTHLLSSPSHEDLLQRCGVNTPENPYESHLLSRREPVLSNPVIQIPDIVKRGFRPRPSAEEIHARIQARVLAKVEDKAKKSSKHSIATNSLVEGNSATNDVDGSQESGSVAQSVKDLLKSDVCAVAGKSAH